jgi:hypothetical protein
MKIVMKALKRVHAKIAGSAAVGHGCPGLPLVRHDSVQVVEALCRQVNVGVVKVVKRPHQDLVVGLVPLKVVSAHGELGRVPEAAPAAEVHLRSICAAELVAVQRIIDRNPWAAGGLFDVDFWEGENDGDAIGVLPVGGLARQKGVEIRNAEAVQDFLCLQSRGQCRGMNI